MKSPLLPFNNFPKKLWRILTEPFEALPIPGDRRRAITASVFLLASFIAVGIEQTMAGNTPFYALILLFTGYIFARTRWYKFATLILLVVLSTPSFMVVIRMENPESNMILAVFVWIILPLLLSSLIYSIRITALFCSVNILVLFALPLIRPELSYSIMASTLGFYILASLFTIIVMVQRDQIENDRRRELVKSHDNLSREVSQKEQVAEQTKKRADQLALLNEVSQAISSLQRLDDILQVIFEQVRNVIPLDVFFVALYDPIDDLVHFPFLFDNQQVWQEQRVALQKLNRITHVIDTGQPILINRNVEEIEEARRSEKRLGEQSQVAASIMISPLQVGSRIIGVLSTQSYTLNAYNEEQFSELTSLAQHIAIAIENARLFEQTTKRAQRLEILNEIGREISTLNDLPTLLENIYQQVQKSLSVDLFFIDLIDEQKNEVSFPFMYENGKRWHQPPKSIDELNGTFTGETIRSRQAILINEWSASANEIESPPTIVGDDKKLTKSLMFAPMLYGHETIGVISVQSYKQNAYNDEDLNLLSGIAHQITNAIKNTRLLEETKEYAGHLSILNELGRVVSEQLNLPNLLDVIYEQVRQHISVDAFYVGLFHPENETVSYPIMYDEGRKYQPTTEKITSHSFLHALLNGGKAALILRTEEDISQANKNEGMLGNTSKLSASLLIAPLKVGEQVIGMISAQSYTLNAYTENDLNLLVGIGNQVGVSIQNARLVEEIKQNAEHLSILNEVGRAVSKLRDLPELLEVIYEQGKKSFSLDAFFVGIYHPEANTVSFPIMYDSGKRFTQETGVVSKNSFLLRFLRGEKSILINRTEAELATGTTQQQSLGEKNRISASIMVAPLISHDTIMGMISAQSYSLNAYNEEDLRLLEGIANQVSIAIENSRLYTSAQQEITERQKVEEQLRDAEAKYRDMVEHVPVVIYSAETGANGRWFYVSPRIESLLGFTADEWTSNPDLWYQQIHGDDRAQVVANEADALARNASMEMEYRMTTRDGHIRWIHDESISVSTSDDQTIIVQGFLMDITARKQMEISLKESEERYHSLFLTAERQARELALLSAVQNALVRDLSLDDLLRTVVEEIAHAFGYTFVSLYMLEDDHLHLRHQVGYEKDQAIEVISIWEGVSGRVVSTGQAILIENVDDEPTFLRASHQVRSEICVPLFDGDAICGTLNVESSIQYSMNDNDLKLMVTLSEQINIAIRRARLYEERAEHLKREQHINEFAHAISSTLELPEILEKVAKVSVALTNAETGTVSLISENGREMVEVYSFNEDSRISDEIIPKGQGLTWLAYEKRRPIIVDDYSRHPEAIPEWKAAGLRAFMGIPITMGETPLGVMAVYNKQAGKKFMQRDLSILEAIARETAVAIQNAQLFKALQKELADHKLTQEQLLNSVQELENKNAELERFTYTVSHDLKSPIVTIGGFLGFLESDLKAGDFERIPHTILRIREAAKKMERLLNELLELSRIGRLINPPAEVPFKELVNETLELVHGQLTAKQVEVRVDADFPVVSVDRVRMVEVLQNLITNAIKFMGDQKHPMIEIGTKIENDENIFFVRDNGVGIASEYHDRIFGLFNKLDQSSEGTGIGLALVKRIIEVHGGRIWVESEVGQGTTFYFTLKNIEENS